MQFPGDDRIWFESILRTITKEEIRAAIAESERGTADAIHDSETKLLTAFHVQIEEIASRVKRLEDAAETRH